MVQKLKALPFSDYILLAALLSLGGFYECISCILCVAMGIFLFLRCRREKKLHIPKDLLTLSVLVLSCAYGIVSLWAVDKGMAFIGFFKFLPLPLFLLCRSQEKKESKLLSLLPFIGAVMTVISLLGMLIPGTKDFFSVADRLAGFFQYPNTFAVFLLVCQLLLFEKASKKWWDYLTAAILLGGILYTGSRTAFVIAVAANGAMLLVTSKKKLFSLLALAGAALCAGLVIFLFRENPVIGRYLRFSLTESTFAGRLLYMQDSLPLLLKHPFGMGYMGYSYIQQSVQTGLYTVAFVHNDWLQLLLDIGWLPALFFIAALGRWFFKKDVPLSRKVIVSSLCLHALMDFDLQYIGMFLLLLKLTETGCAKKTVKLKAAPVAAGAVAVAVGALYMGISLSLSAFGLYSASVALYPGNTVSNLRLLEQATEVAEADRIADRILKTNKSFYAPYSAKAKYAFSQGDFAVVIENKQKAFKANPFGYEEYEEYCRMLITGISLYEQGGDTKSAAVCRKELKNTLALLEGNEKKLSKLGKAIEDQPVTGLPGDIVDYIQALK